MTELLEVQPRADTGQSLPEVLEAGDDHYITLIRCYFPWFLHGHVDTSSYTWWCLEHGVVVQRNVLLLTEPALDQQLLCPAKT